MTLGLTVRLAMAGLAFGMGVAMGGCSAGCVSSDQKLARLTPGMSYGEVSAVMGCQGRLVRGSLDDADTYAIAEWPGPTSLLLHQTDMLFFDRRLLWYDSRSASGF